MMIAFLIHSLETISEILIGENEIFIHTQISESIHVIKLIISEPLKVEKEEQKSVVASCMPSNLRHIMINTMMLAYICVRRHVRPKSVTCRQYKKISRHTYMSFNVSLIQQPTHVQNRYQSDKSNIFFITTDDAAT